jgi:hypothetical protein
MSLSIGFTCSVRTTITFLGAAARLLASSPPCSRRLQGLPPSVRVHGFLSALHRSERLHQQSTIPCLCWCSGSAVGYTTFKHPLVLLIKTSWMMIILCLHNKLHDATLISVVSIFMMFNLNKHIYDTMIIL